MPPPPLPVPEPAADILARCLGGRDGPRSDMQRTLRLFAQWPSVVGPQIAQRTRPYALQRGVLWVESESSTWQTELSLMRPQLIAKLNAALGGQVVKDLRVRCGVAPPPAPPPPPPRAPPTAADWRSAQGLAAAIGDPEVRDAFALLVASQLAHDRRS